jgi:hypothetical protein
MAASERYQTPHEMNRAIGFTRMQLPFAAIHLGLNPKRKPGLVRLKKVR